MYMSLPRRNSRKGNIIKEQLQHISVYQPLYFIFLLVLHCVSLNLIRQHVPTGFPECKEKIRWGIVLYFED